MVLREGFEKSAFLHLFSVTDDGSDLIHGRFSAKLEFESLQVAISERSQKVIWFIIVENEFLANPGEASQNSPGQKERSLQLFFDLNGLPPPDMRPLCLLFPNSR